MNSIKLLSENVSNRIAAGEVVERPYSVVKELVENSIDAGSKRISVYLERSGKKLIKVVDDGIGLSYDDSLMAFERHATSKISTQEDIFSISTLGFRGEALPSIASVSKLSFITKREVDDIASKVEFDFGRLKNVSCVSANKGTTVTVERLFSLLPARKKFLKSDPVEYKHIFSYIHYQTVLFPNIHFKLVHNGKETLNYPIVSSIELRLKSIFGKKFIETELIKVDKKANNIKFTGFIGTFEEKSLYFSNIHYLFINGRFVRDKIVYHALRKAFDPLIKKYDNQLPVFILFIEMDPKAVDFNVHPSKQEIRFRDASMVHSFVQNSIKSLFLEYQQNRYEDIKDSISISSKVEDHNFYFDNNKNYNKFDKISIDKQIELFGTPIESLGNVHEKEYLINEKEAINPWQLHQSYIFLQDKQGLLVIDQHAAHERIIYEKTIQRLNGLKVVSQKLVLPLVLDFPIYLKDRIKGLLNANKHLLKKVGFSIKSYSGDSLVVDEIPVELQNWDSGKIFWEILQNLEKEFKQTNDIKDAIAKSLACKAAIKSGERISQEQMMTLVNNLFACQVPFFCPHGRPLIVKIPIDFFHKKFKRI